MRGFLLNEFKEFLFESVDFFSDEERIDEGEICV